MTIVVDEFWWKNLCRHIQRMGKGGLSEYGVLSLCGDAVVAARAVVDSHKIWDEAKGEAVVPDAIENT